MKTNYENWMPKDLINYMKYACWALFTIFVAISAYIFMRKANGQAYLHWLSIVDTMFLFAAISLFYFIKKFTYMHEAFDFSNENSIAWKIINYTADNMQLETGKKILDVGCGSGALSIAVAKRNPDSTIVGIDKWGMSYKSFTQNLCQNNATAENISNVEFEVGDAVKLDFDDESFDGLVSNYVYHNIPGNRQTYLLESLRTLKKGGKFAIHDIFTKVKYGNMDEFIAKLKADGYEKVELIDTTDGTAISPEETKATMLHGSKLLVGIK